MIDFDRLDSGQSAAEQTWRDAVPFPIVVLDDFLLPESAEELLRDFPDPDREPLNRSRDYVFAKNKYEKSDIGSVSPAFGRLADDLTSDRFSKFLHAVTGREIRIDETFHGGGCHAGGEGSYLDMHTDFDMHPMRPTWRREANILVYLNKDWRKAYGGELRLRRRETGRAREIEPVFNRCVLMQTSGETIHGYSRIAFPPGNYRRSIAAYAYEELDEVPATSRSSQWYPDEGGPAKKWLGRAWPQLVRLKSKFLGSATARNR
ncbi:MAG: 2OG-Fe(II) oxygenase [Pseudomonadota bacterium]